MTGPERRIRVAGIVAHRRAGFRSEPPIVVIRRGLPVTNLDQTLVDCWPLMSGPDQRAPIIAAVSDRRTTPTRVRHLLNEADRLTGRAALYALLDKLQAGCRSELELWGYDRVFTGPGLPVLRRQYPVRLGGHTVYLDVFAENERTNFELDGTTWHGSVEQRERDLRRDAGLAAMGILVIRFTHDRLTSEPDAVRRDVLRILAARH
ncbi:MAG TPA: DUF559 domain-containing protein [Actinomycetes bacterium]|nr:DUF559 domain-containing protein [Actinomycetes bacterium]